MSIDSSPLPTNQASEGNISLPEKPAGLNVDIASTMETSADPIIHVLSEMAENGKLADEPEQALEQIANADLSQQTQDIQLLEDESKKSQDEKKLTPEQRTKLLSEAMGEFKVVLDGFRQLKTADSTYVEGIGKAALRIAKLANSGEYKRDALAQPIDQIATQFGSEMVNKVKQIGQQAEQMGISRTQIEGDMNSLLKQIAATEDPAQKAELIKKSLSLFQQTTTLVEQVRTEQRTKRVGIQATSEQNASIAKRNTNETSQYTKVDERSAPVVYQRHSSAMAQLITEGNQSVTTIENIVTSNNRRHQERFISIMGVLNR